LGKRENQAGGWRGTATGIAVAYFWPTWPEVPGPVRKKSNKKRADAECSPHGAIFFIFKQ